MKTAYAIPTAHIDAYISEMRRRLLTKQIGDSPCIFSFFPNFNFFGAYKDFVGLALRFPEHAAKKWPQMSCPFAGDGELSFAPVGHGGCRLTFCSAGRPARTRKLARR